MLELKNVKMVFNPATVNEKYALNSLNMKLNRGDFVTLIGANGSGKSTVLNVIAGVYSPQSGSIILDGEDMTRRAEHQRAAHISRVFQDPMLGTASDMQIEENLALSRRRGKKRGLKWGISRAERQLYKEKLGRLKLGLEERLSVKTGLLSGGQRQALTLLMATMNTPKLLLLDEHTAALDPATAQKVLELTDEIINEQHLTALMVTHNMKDALAYGNRLIMLNEGKILLDIAGEEKKRLSVADLMERFFALSGSELAEDGLLLVR